MLGRLPKTSAGKPSIPVVPIPFLTAEQLADPVKNAAKYRIPLLNQALVLADPAAAASEVGLRRAFAPVPDHGQPASLLEVARQDLAALDAWRSLVRAGQAEFTSRYRREFLNGERFRRFDGAREQLMDMLELPGAGRLVSLVLYGIRTPYRLIRGYMNKALAPTDAVNLPEEQVLESSMRAWLDLLRADALRRADTHLLWRHVVNGFNSGLADTATERFHNDLRRFQLSSADEIDSVCRAMTGGLEQNHSLLASLRVGKLLLDTAAVAFGFWAGGLTWWEDLIFIPVFASGEHQAVELVVWQYVEQKRSVTRRRKEMLVNQAIAAPIGEWLTQWPSTGGSAYERLQVTLRRVPELIRTLGEEAEKSLVIVISH